ncbi:hypothetical protein Y032_0029g1921 [Ancylostoma ceylanicum]|uniref:Uncharacterized protein n=1 Tax=Ancylostoma ceylanicum TaxID=53326 RepID=A0A016USR0_9BILA|nr:hypothetical protein Y032_0029g1921 [Ancylostoma ceylanicum]
MVCRSASPPDTPTKRSVSHQESLKKNVSRKCSQEPKRSLGEALDSPMHLPQRPFKAAHDSFRLRMFQEQHGFEPVVCQQCRTIRKILSTTAF